MFAHCARILRFTSHHYPARSNYMRKTRAGCWEEECSPLPNNPLASRNFRHIYHGTANASIKPMRDASMSEAISVVCDSNTEYSTGVSMTSSFVSAPCRESNSVIATGHQESNQHNGQWQAEQQRGESPANLPPTGLSLFLRGHMKAPVRSEWVRLGRECLARICKCKRCAEVVVSLTR